MGLAVALASASRSASLVPVLPTEPVTAMIFACARARAARAEVAHAVEHVGHDEQRRVRWQRGAPLRRDDRERRRRPRALPRRSRGRRGCRP